MTARAFLRDRLPAILIRAFAHLLTVIFLLAFRIPHQALAAAILLPLCGTVPAELWEYRRRKRFYDRLRNNAEGLERKYLLSETLPDPDFAEGRILKETLRDAGKSMAEEAAECRRDADAFREYIELWVHEIKLPLAAMRLLCYNGGCGRCGEQMNRMDDCVENVLFYARSGSPEKDYVIGPVSLKRVFSDTAQRHREELQSRGVSIRTEGLDTAVYTDAKWLAWILGQLMSNSMKYFSPEKDREPQIIVSAEELPDRTVLRFRDNGIGIPARDLPYIFEKSFTGQNGRARPGSTGMGLYVAKKLCARLGHGMEAESEEGKYTEIRLLFGKSGYTAPLSAENAPRDPNLSEM